MPTDAGSRAAAATSRRSVRVRRVILAGLVVFLAGLSALAALVPRYALSKARVERILSDYFDSQVELRSFDISLWPVVHLEVQGLVLRHHGRTDVPPLISVSRLTVDTSVLGAIRQPTHLQRVAFRGMRVYLPPRRGDPRREPAPARRDQAAAKPPARTGTPVVVDVLTCEDGELAIGSDDPAKKPLTFELHRLTFHSVALDRPLAFDAQLTNPKPRGFIDASGEFGPFERAEPGLTPIKGRYRFEHADLATVGGIAGMLSSTGEFGGQLARIRIDGETITPDFRLQAAGHPVPLATRFDATVNGTNGNTYLQPVRATLGQSAIVARGAVAEERGEDGRTVALDVTVAGARLEDFLRLALKSATVPMSGALDLTTRFRLPPGDRDVLERLQLDGQFHVEHARFARGGVQERVNELSRRGRGEPDAAATDVVSNLAGKFVLRDATMRFSALRFEVPGAAVSLRGACQLDRQVLDFRGTLTLKARPSAPVTGAKSTLLKVLDPLFGSKRAGTVVPIRVSGTTERPSFGVEVGQLLAGRSK